MKSDSNPVEMVPVELEFDNIKLSCPIEAGHRMIPVRTICLIIDVDFARQDSWLKKHPIYGQLYKPMPTVAADNKERTMNCLSFFDAYGWLNSIGEKDRKPGSFEKQTLFLAWLRERIMEFYKAVDVWRQENRYELELVEQKEAVLNEIELASNNLKEAKKRLSTINSSIEEVRSKRFTGQTALAFPEA